MRREGGRVHESFRGRPRGRFGSGSAGTYAGAFGGRPRFGSGTAAGSSRNARQVTARDSATATGARKALWYGVWDVAPQQNRRVITFGELSRSPVEEAASR
jgi:hypothetical protein